MIRHRRPLLAVPVAAGSILLSARGSDEGSSIAAATSTVTATAAAPAPTSVSAPAPFSAGWRCRAVRCRAVRCWAVVLPGGGVRCGRPGNDPAVTTRHRILPAVCTAAVLAVLPACGSGGGAPQGDAPPSSLATAGETTVAPGGEAGSGQQADIEFGDQSGDGGTAVVDTVSAPEGGFLVIVVDDDTVLGSVQLPVGTTSDVEVPLDPALTEDAELTATLYADTDRDGEFDPEVDQVVPAPISGADPDDDTATPADPVQDDAEYSLS